LRQLPVQCARTYLKVCSTNKLRNRLVGLVCAKAETK
jgi:hypothetical protein